MIRCGSRPLFWLLTMPASLRVSCPYFSAVRFGNCAPRSSSGLLFRRGAPFRRLRTEVPLEFSPATCYFWKMSDRMFAQTCPNCGGICPQQAETCKYCKFSFSSTNVLSERAGSPKEWSADCRGRSRYPHGSRLAGDQHLALLAYCLTIRHPRSAFKLTVFPSVSKMKFRRWCGP